jgi:hypothetical protein
VGLSEHELIVARRELDDLYDRLYVLEAAIEDVDRDLADDPTFGDYRDAVAWLLAAARPVVEQRPFAEKGATGQNMHSGRSGDARRACRPPRMHHLRSPRPCRGSALR